MRRVLQADPRAGYLAEKAAIDRAVSRALESGQYILGGEVEAFEQEWAAYVGAEFAVGVGNGTDALELALRALGVGVGDAVVTTANTAVATVAAIELAGATPLLVDVEPGTLTMNPAALESAIHNAGDLRIRAVIPVHLFGHPADMRTITDIARRHQLLVIEDCAQAHGAAIEGHKVGTFGDLSAFSFYPTKNLAALGDGGAVVTNDAPLAERLRHLRMYGWRTRYVSEWAGMNSRLDDLQAAILRARLPHLDAGNSRRIQVASRYSEAFSGTSLQLPETRSGCTHVFHQYVVRLAGRDQLRDHLDARGISTAVLYPVPIHHQPAYRGRIAVPASLRVTEQAATELLCLPIHPWISDEDVERVITEITDWLRQQSR